MISRNARLPHFPWDSIRMENERRASTNYSCCLCLWAYTHETAHWHGIATLKIQLILSQVLGHSCYVMIVANAESIKILSRQQKTLSRRPYHINVSKKVRFPVVRLIIKVLFSDWTRRIELQIRIAGLEEIAHLSIQKRWWISVTVCDVRHNQKSYWCWNTCVQNNQIFTGTKISFESYTIAIETLVDCIIRV